MKQYTDEEINRLTEKYNTLTKPQYKITEDWIYHLLGEAYEYSILVKNCFKIPKKRNNKRK